jgi:hypothetical protein
VSKRSAIIIDAIIATMKGAIIAAIIAAFMGGVARAAPSPFAFDVPPGWRDLTPGVPETHYAGVPPEVTAQIKKTAPLFFAADVSDLQGRFNVRATLVPGSGVITDESLAGYVRDLKTAGAKFDGTEMELDDWNGITVGKISGELTIRDSTIAQVVYVIPGPESRVFLTYSTMPAELARYAPVFDAAARATRGAVQPVSFFERRGVRGTLLAFIGAVIALVVIRRAKNRRASQDDAAT